MMDMQVLTSFFLWCTILNVGLLVISFLLLNFMGDFAYKMHRKWFPISRETFNIAIYSFIGIYKIMVFVFNVVPLVALLIIG